MDQLPRLGKRELICLLSFACNYVVFVWRGFLFLWVLGMGYVILLWHSLSLPYNYFAGNILSILIWTKGERCRAYQSAPYLIALAVSDSCNLCFSGLVFAIEYLFRFSLYDVKTSLAVNFYDRLDSSFRFCQRG